MICIMISPAGDFCFQSSELIPLFHSIVYTLFTCQTGGMIQISAPYVDTENTIHFPHAYTGDMSSAEFIWDPCTMVSLMFLLLLTLLI